MPSPWPPASPPVPGGTILLRVAPLAMHSLPPWAVKVGYRASEPLMASLAPARRRCPPSTLGSLSSWWVTGAVPTGVSWGDTGCLGLSGVLWDRAEDVRGLSLLSHGVFSAIGEPQWLPPCRVARWHLAAATLNSV